MHGRAAQLAGVVGRTDTPSDLLAEVHIYIVPHDKWIPYRRLAKNHVVEETVSAGFVSVSPELSLTELRGVLADQLPEEEMLHHFVFIKSVGRNFTQVKPYQEGVVKVKSFLPPRAPDPEIHILELSEELLRRAHSLGSLVLSETEFSDSQLSSAMGRSPRPGGRSSSVDIWRRQDVALEEEGEGGSRDLGTGDSRDMRTGDSRDTRTGDAENSAEENKKDRARLPPRQTRSARARESDEESGSSGAHPSTGVRTISARRRAKVRGKRSTDTAGGERKASADEGSEKGGESGELEADDETSDLNSRRGSVVPNDEENSDHHSRRGSIPPNDDESSDPNFRKGSKTPNEDENRKRSSRTEGSDFEDNPDTGFQEGDPSTSPSSLNPREASELPLDGAGKLRPGDEATNTTRRFSTNKSPSISRRNSTRSIDISGRADDVLDLHQASGIQLSSERMLSPTQPGIKKVGPSAREILAANRKMQADAAPKQKWGGMKEEAQRNRVNRAEQGKDAKAGPGGASRAPLGRGGKVPIGRGGKVPVVKNGKAPLGKDGKAPLGKDGKALPGRGGVAAGGRGGKGGLQRSKSEPGDSERREAAALRRRGKAGGELGAVGKAASDGDERVNSEDEKLEEEESAGEGGLVRNDEEGAGEFDEVDAGDESVEVKGKGSRRGSAYRRDGKDGSEGEEEGWGENDDNGGNSESGEDDERGNTKKSKAALRRNSREGSADILNVEDGRLGSSGDQDDVAEQGFEVTYDIELKNGEVIVTPRDEKSEGKRRSDGVARNAWGSANNSNLKDEGSAGKRLRKISKTSKTRTKKLTEAEMREELDALMLERKESEERRKRLFEEARRLHDSIVEIKEKRREQWWVQFTGARRKGTALEEHQAALRAELDQLHRKIIGSIVKRSPLVTGVRDEPSRKANLKISVIRLRHEIEDLKKRHESMDIKLETETKLKNRAEKEVKQLRQEVSQKKIDVALSRSKNPYFRRSLGDIPGTF